MTALHIAQALVATHAATRYAKQLRSHLGQKAEICSEPDGLRVILGAGSCLLLARADALELRAESDTLDGLDRTKEVVGSHLERFGQREGLAVQWTSHR